MPLSPDPLNYFLGKGVVKIKVAGVDLTFRDVGNAPLFEITPSVVRLEHYSSRRGIRFKDRSVVTQKQLTCKIHLDEFTKENLAMVLMGQVTAAGPPGIVSIMDIDEVEAAIRLVGTNEVGSKCQVDLPTVNLAPSAAVPLIGETWGILEITGEVTADPITGAFGTIHTDITGEIS